MEQIERISQIKREALRGEHYFQSLLQQAHLAQLLSEAQLEAIQLDCLGLLAKRTEAFNGGDSSSIRIETAQEILASILFTLGVSLKTHPNPDDAVAAIQHMGVAAIYAEGRKRIGRLLGRTITQHGLLVSHLLHTKNVFYAATIVDGIHGFFKLYDAEFAAHEIHITADYPVYNKADPLLGIEFIQQYLQQLQYENLFCTQFSDADIHHLLCGYDERYEELLFNLYEPVLAAALGCALADAPARSLGITPQIQSCLYHYFTGKRRGEIEQILGGALAKLGEGLALSDSLLAYVQQSLPQLATSIECAMKTERLDRVFIASRYPEDQSTLTVSYGEKMDDARYRQVLAMFMSSQSMSDKIGIVHTQIHSLADVEDLLLDAQLRADEITDILKSLDPAEVMALMKKYGPAYAIDASQLRSCEKTLCEGLLAAVAHIRDCGGFPKNESEC